MSASTEGERSLAARIGLSPEEVASAREVLNFIAALSWPRPERVALLTRLARGERADVGRVLGGMALDAAPLTGFDQLIPLIGLAEKRVTGLARALAGFDVSTLSREARELHAARQAIAALRLENEALRTELDRQRAMLASTTETGAAPRALPLTELTASLGSQVSAAEASLRSGGARALRLSGLQLRIQGTATVLNDEVALDVASPRGGSAVTLAFSPGDAPAALVAEAPVPDVRGYAPALARRKVEERGFGATFLGTGEGAGVVREQSPAPGVSAPRGSRVRLIVG